MAILDIILLLCFVPAIVLGISKGFVKQLVEILAILVGAWAAFRFSSALSMYLAQYLTFDKQVIRVICFVIILIVAALLLSLLGEMLTRFLKLASLGWINHLLGLIFGVVKTSFILGLLILLFEALNNSLQFVRDGALDNAVVYQALKNFANSIFPYLKFFVTGINV